MPKQRQGGDREATGWRQEGRGPNLLGSSRPLFNDFRAVTTLRRGVKPVRTPVAILGSLGVCIYVPASRQWLISYSLVHLN